MRLSASYDPEFGRTSILIKNPNQVIVEEDRNKCSLDNYGMPLACTLMAIRITESTLNLIEENENFKLLEFASLKYLRLVFTKNNVTLLRIEEKSGRVIKSLPLIPEFNFQ